MRLLSFAWVMALAPAVPSVATVGDAPPDLRKIDRTIAREPAYESKAPRYALLVFGPEAKTRVWLVLDGETLYVDRNRDGDLTGKGERVTPDKRDLFLNGEGGKKVRVQARAWEVGDIADADGKAKHTELSVAMGKVGEAPADWTILVNLNGKQTQFARCGPFVFGPSAREAPVIQFGGPLTMHLFAWERSVLDPKEYNLTVNVGTQGLGTRSFASLTVEAAPERAHPLAEIAFPGKRPADAPVRVKVELRQRC
jgi:hypothetical protein